MIAVNGTFKHLILLNNLKNDIAVGGDAEGLGLSAGGCCCVCVLGCCYVLFVCVAFMYC